MELAPERRADWLARLAADEPELAARLQRLIAAEEAEAGLDASHLHRQIDQTLRDLMPESLASGTTVGAYRVIEEIGAGGMGRVFRAQRDDPSLHHEVAIKVVRRDMMTPQALTRFQAERAVLARLQHPGICQFIDAGTLDDGSPYVVMELLRDAIPIAAFADRERLDIDQRIDLFRRVLDAVQYAHRNLIVHRDIKAGNVLVLPDGQPKLLDFGIAKSIADDAGHRVTATSERFFSLATAAPEQLTGAPVTVACDIYSLGVLLYELLAGYAPFADAGDSLPVLIEQIAHRIPPPMRQTAARLDASGLSGRRASASTLARDLSGDIEDIVQRCLRKDPGERYRSVDALDADLQRLREGLPISLRGSQAGYRLRKFVARHRIASALSAALLLSLIASAWIVALQNVRIRAERDQAEEALSIMRDAFLSADPARTGGESLTAREVLDSALPSIRQRRETHPRLYAQLGLTVGEVYAALGMLRDAERLLEDIRSEDLDSARQSDRLSMLIAQVATQLGSVSDAREIIELHQPRLGQTPEWKLEFARMLGGELKFDEALIALNSVVAMTTKRRSTDPVAVQARVLRVQFLLRLNDLDGASKALDELDNWLGDIGIDHPLRTHLDLQRITLVRRMGQTEHALELAEQTFKRALDQYGESSPFVAQAEAAIAASLLVLNRTAEARNRFESVLTRQISRLGPTSRESLMTRLNLIDISKRLGDPADQTMKLISDAMPFVEARFGPASTPVAYLLREKTNLLLSDGHITEARAILNAPGTIAAVRASSPVERAEWDALQELMKSKG